MNTADPLIDERGRHLQCHGSVQAMTRSGAPGAMLDTLTHAGGPYRQAGGCDVLVSVSGGTFDADFVLTPEGAERFAASLQKAAAMARKVAKEVRAAASKGAP